MSTKSELLSLFEKNTSEYISGQKIGDTLNVSRNAVWKAVEQLRSEGYEIESRPKTGYRLVTCPDHLSSEIIREGISSPCDLMVFDTVSSTITIAEETDIKDKPLFIVADCQTAGKGRLGRSFASPSGTGLYLTIAIKPDFAINEALYVTMAAAVATARAIEKVCKIHADIKWVNDLFYNNRKISGILTKAQSNLELGQIDKLIIGIGINCFPGSLPEELEHIAGPVSNEKGSFSRNELASEVFNETMEILKDLQSKSFMKEYKRRCFILGEIISVHPHLDDRKVKAYAVDIADDGGLIVEYTEGEKKGITETLTTGEVSIRLE